MYEQILYDVAGPVATITLNRPEALNAWTPRMADEVRHAVERAEDDAAVVGIVLTGAGRAFCAGADVRAFDEFAAQLTERVRAEEGGVPGDLAGEHTYLLAVRKPVIAAVNGAIAGMAVPIALCCDLRFMASDAPLVTAFAQMGLVAEWGVSWLLPRLVGPAVALDLLMSSRRIDGAEAARLGLVNAALPAGEVLAHSRRYVEELADRCSPSSIAAMKRQVYEQLHAGLGAAEQATRRLMLEAFEGPDGQEGVRSFLEKRLARFARIGAAAARQEPSIPLEGPWS